ncbi:hypothetical protein KR018_006798, partial [Drosophila ironensis]
WQLLAEVTPNLEAVLKAVTPLVRSPLGQAVISFILGYYATTKLSQIYQKFRGNSGDATETETLNSDQQDSDKHDELLHKGERAVILNPTQLATFNGLRKEQPIYTALNGKIYDLSPARDMFGNQGPYSLLAGCNANRVLNIACGSMGVCTDDVVHRWEQSLKAEFNIVGTLIDSEAE